MYVNYVFSVSSSIAFFIFSFSKFLIFCTIALSEIPIANIYVDLDKYPTISIFNKNISMHYITYNFPHNHQIFHRHILHSISVTTKYRFSLFFQYFQDILNPYDSLELHFIMEVHINISFRIIKNSLVY